MKDWKKELFTIPNLLSLCRLVLIPVYIVIYLNATEAAHYAIAASILAVSCLTDLVDGKIARHFDMSSTVGKVLDPVADKATQFALTVCLAVKHPVLWYLAGLFVIKEGFQLIAGLITIHQGKMLNGALLSGKVCTCVLFVSLIFLVLFPEINPEFVRLITIIDAVFMLFSLMQYILVYFNKNSFIQDLPKAEN